MSSEIANSKVLSVFGGLTFVLTSNELNSDSFKAIWFGSKALVRPNEIPDNAQITPPAIIIPSDAFQLTVLPNRIQIHFPSDNEADIAEPLARIFAGVLRAYPATPFGAMGINIEYFLSPDEASAFAAWNNQLFSSPFSRALCQAGDPKDRFGSYFSHDIRGFRMKLDAKPAHSVAHIVVNVTEALKARPEWVQLAFNFHMDLRPPTPALTAIESLPQWPFLAQHARSIVSAI
jgi:hypothetical protein